MSNQAVTTRLDHLGATAVHEVTATAAGRRLAWAAVTSKTCGCAFVNIHVESGVLPRRTRELLVDGVLSVVSSIKATEVLLVVPSRDAELIETLRQRCLVESARPVGSTCLIRGKVLAAPRATAVPTLEAVDPAASRVSVRIDRDP